MSTTNKIAGMIMIIIAFIMFTLFLPNMVASVQTKSGSALENETASVKLVLSLYDYLFAVIPIFLIVFGIGLLWKG